MKLLTLECLGHPHKIQIEILISIYSMISFVLTHMYFWNLLNLFYLNFTIFNFSNKCFSILFPLTIYAIIFFSKICEKFSNNCPKCRLVTEAQFMAPIVFMGVNKCNGSSVRKIRNIEKSLVFLVKQGTNERISE